MNKALLVYEMKMKKITTEELCRRLNISTTSFYRKCNGTSEFTQSEIQNIIDILGLTTPVPIFFSKEVS